MPQWDDQKEQVQQATDIVALIGEQLRLTPKGKEFVGLCPFHDDSNPSMFVSPTKQIYKCFSCGAGGDAYGFVMNYHKMTFPEAMKYLAERAGIKLTQRGQDADNAASQQRKRISDANDKALKFFQGQLRDEQRGQIAREYLQQRGFAPETIEQFQIGYAPDGWDGLATAINQRGWSLHAFEQAGLISPRKQGDGYYDRLRHRLIFPICDAIGRPIAFGGRKLRAEDEPKYLNSPETPLFNKSATLYGLHLAKQAILHSRTAVIVEGYTDVTSCHQAGAKNVVATLGTALTKEHMRALRHFADRVVLIFDADEAGYKAADRALEIFIGGTVDVAIAVLPEGLDPADLMAKAEGKAQWDQAIKDATEALDYQFQRMRQRFDDAGSLAGQQRIAEEYLGRLAALGVLQMTPIRRALVIQRVGHLLHLPEETVTTMLRELAPRRPQRPAQGSTSGGASPAAAPGQPASQQPNPSASRPLPDAGAYDPHLEHEVHELEPNWDEAPQSDRPRLASPQNMHRIKALEAVERLLVAGLLREPGLFHLTLPDGRDLDEAVLPADLCSPLGAEAYQLLYDRLAEGQPTTLTHLLGEAASRQRSEVSAWLTQADADLEQVLGDKTDRLSALVADLASQFVALRRQREEAETRQAALTGEVHVDGQVVTVDQEQLLKQIAERQRSQSSPVRIARFRSS